MRMVISPLLSKEIRQNLLIYLTPLPIVLLALFLRGQGGFTGDRSWLDSVFTLAMPLALAVALGLQAFDVEIDAQTRDFLLVKPLSTWRIIWDKFLLGLAILLGWCVILLLAVNPSYLTWPRPLPVSTWLGPLILSWAALVYGAGFFVGLVVRGPKKMLAACLLGGLVAVCYFVTWSSWATFAAHSAFHADRPWLADVFFYGSGAAILLALGGLFLSLTAWILRGRPSFRRERGPVFFQILLLSMFFLGLGLNFGITPPFRAAYFLGLELFDLEQPFWCAAGAWRPGGRELAVAGPKGLLGLVKPGGKPRVIYRGRPDDSLVIDDLVWSPDGEYLAFTEGGWVYVLRLGTDRPARIGRGSSPCWAQTSDMLLYTAQISTAPIPHLPNAPGIAYRIKLNLFDLRRRATRPVGRLTSLGSSWYWDSRTGLFLLVDAYGQVHLLRNGEDRTVPLPGVQYGVTWHRFYPLPGKDAEYLLAVISLRGLHDEHYNLHFYRFDARRPGADPIREIQGLELGNVILDPETGRCLLGRQGVYRRVDLLP